jgi:hypothetical protein
MALELNNEIRTLSIIRLMGKTGFCLEKLTNSTITKLLSTVISLIKGNDFVDVLLPWLSALVKHQFLDP